MPWRVWAMGGWGTALGQHTCNRRWRDSRLLVARARRTAGCAGSCKSPVGPGWR